jgi:AcrR family transcriptional regulator
MRTDQLVSTFIALIAAKGLEATSLNDVAEASGVSRTAIRHFVGNRENLIAAAVSSLTASYSKAIIDAVGQHPKPTDLVKVLFSPSWSDATTSEPQAFDALLHEASRDAGLSALIRHAYQTLMDLIVTSLRAHSEVRRANSELEAAAYVILCLAEHNATMRAIGFDKRSARFAFHHAVALVDSLTRAPLDPDPELPR